MDFWCGWGLRPGVAGKACSPQPPHPRPSKPQFPICKVKSPDPKTAGVQKHNLRAQKGRRLRPDGRVSVSISTASPSTPLTAPVTPAFYKEEMEARGEDLTPQGTAAGWDPHEKAVAVYQPGPVSSQPLLTSWERAPPSALQPPS